MGVDVGRVRQRASFVREQIAALTAIAVQTDVDTFAADRVRASAARYLLQTAIEGLIDLAYHLSAKLAQRAPSNAHDAFLTMSRLGILEADAMPRLHDMLRLRNRIVHGYLDVDERRVYGMITGGEIDDIAHTLGRLENAALGTVPVPPSPQDEA